MQKYRIWVLADVVAVVVFCAIGRANHAEAASLSGLFGTAWPFLTGLAIGWAAAVVVGADPRGLVPGGAAIWFATLAAGMALRAVSGQGTATAFVIVAAITLAAFLFGWRGARAVAAKTATR